MKRQLEDFAAARIVRSIVDLLTEVSEQNLFRLTYLAEKLTHEPETLAAIRAIRDYLENPNHPTKALFRRVLERLTPSNRAKIFETLFYRGWFLGGKKRTFLEKENGFRPPFVMIVSPTLNCNLRCKGCYTLGYGTKPELPGHLVDSALSECEEMGIYFVTVLGGEPLLYPHLFEMIEGHPQIFFQVYTNGTLVTSEIARRFADCGNVMVVLSIEGYEAETDAWRGKGVYAKIMRAFEHLANAGVLAGSSATVTRENVDTVASEAFIDHMIACGSFLQNYFLYIPVNGRADFSIMVTPEQRDHLRRQVLRFRATKPMFFLDFWNDGPYVGGCIAGGRRYFHLNAKGDIEPCVYTHVAVDNIRNTSLKQALNSPLFQCIRRRQPHNGNHLRPCMIIDNPHVMREVIAETRPYFTHPGAEEIYTVRSKEMDEYARRFGEYADRIWEEEYKNEDRVSRISAGR